MELTSEIKTPAKAENKTPELQHLKIKVLKLRKKFYLNKHADGYLKQLNVYREKKEEAFYKNYPGLLQQFY